MSAMSKTQLRETELVVSLDFVQQELLILGAESQDPDLLSCYIGNNRRDVHSSTGAKILNVERARDGLSPVSYLEFKDMVEAKDQRANDIRKKYAKNTNFLAVYGGSASGLSRKIILPYDTAEKFLEAFYETFPRVRDFQEATVRFARQHGFVKTMFGTRKHCRGIFDKNPAIRAGWERQAVNMLIQGGAAAVLKIVLRLVVLSGLLKRTRSTLYYPVYDELVLSVPVSELVTLITELQQIMAVTLPTKPISPTLLTSVSIGHNWGEQLELGESPTQNTIEVGRSIVLSGMKYKEMQPRFKEITGIST